MKSYKKDIYYLKLRIVSHLMDGDASEYFSINAQDILCEAMEEVLKENTGSEEQYWKLYSLEHVVKRIYDDFRKYKSGIISIRIGNPE